MFKLSTRSLSHLMEVKQEMIVVVKRAIEITNVDFGVIDGIRTTAEQRELVQKGVSQTMQSKHLTGDAVDVMAYVNGKGRWDAALYDDIADAFKSAATELDVKIRWGGSWHIDDIRHWPGNMREATRSYRDLRISEGKKPFFDFGHFELNWRRNEDVQGIHQGRVNNQSIW